MGLGGGIGLSGCLSLALCISSIAFLKLFLFRTTLSCLFLDLLIFLFNSLFMCLSFFGSYFTSRDSSIPSGFWTSPVTDPFSLSWYLCNNEGLGGGMGLVGSLRGSSEGPLRGGRIVLGSGGGGLVGFGGLRFTITSGGGSFDCQGQFYSTSKNVRHYQVRKKPG